MAFGILFKVYKELLSKTVIWTAGNRVNPVIQNLGGVLRKSAQSRTLARSPHVAVTESSGSVCRRRLYDP